MREPIDDDESGAVDIEAGSSLDFLQTVYRDPCQPISRRMRVAVAALPFELPKLAVTATLGPNSGFAARFEEAIARSAKNSTRGWGSHTNLGACRISVSI